MCSALFKKVMLHSWQSSIDSIGVKVSGVAVMQFLSSFHMSFLPSFRMFISFALVKHRECRVRNLLLPTPTPTLYPA
jgi:hypothetical protein